MQETQQDSALTDADARYAAHRSIAHLKSIADDISERNLFRVTGKLDEAAYVKEVILPFINLAEAATLRGDLILAADSVGRCLARVRVDLIDREVLVPTSNSLDVETRLSEIQDALKSIGFDESKTVAVVSASGTTQVIWWNNYALAAEIAAVGPNASDLMHPKLPEEPGVYVWSGRLVKDTGGNLEDYNLFWNGWLRTATIDDLAELGVTSTGPVADSALPCGKLTDEIALISVGPDLTAILCEAIGAVAGRFVREGNTDALEAGFVDLPTEPGLYVWRGEPRMTSHLPGFEEVDWLGSTRRATLSDFTEFGLSYSDAEQYIRTTGATHRAVA
ncbi:hypothetical protein ACFOY8_13815 [Thalassospira xianhensis]|uniref:Uncharacterized protein n=1 Tax=Thalassospira xianhensis MCCC 1A02616 TaxID=1177929 RepID=A0A367UKT6_9PROT|nr:hypothetical protein [Thalassospira xianhensis]RCK07742.1 hypothetical protein TH5_01460 [Thalassospira xianhensis MCCC 1A02616]